MTKEQLLVLSYDLYPLPHLETSILTSPDTPLKPSLLALKYLLITLKALPVL
jgi:hypothetical protein